MDKQCEGAICGAGYPPLGLKVQTPVEKTIKPTPPVDQAVAQIQDEQKRAYGLIDLLNIRLASVIDQNGDDEPTPNVDRGPSKSALHSQLLAMAYEAGGINAHLERILRRLSV